MKNLLKNKKFLVALAIVTVLLSTTAFAYAVNSIFPEMDSKGSYGTSDTINFEGQYLTIEDLKERYDILCCYHGGNDSHLRGVAAATLTAGGSSTTVTDSGKNIGELTKADEGNQTALTISGSSNPQTPYTDSAYYSESWAWYEATEIVVTSPDNSYILAEMISEVEPEDRLKIFYGNGYSTVQYAWWVTDDNRGTNHSTLNTLYYEAEAFYSYIRQIAKSVNEDDFVDTDYEYTDPNGEVHAGTVPAPELVYEPKYNEDANQDGRIEQDDDGRATGEDKVTATFDTDTNTWTIGPFSIDYVEESFSLADLGETFEYTEVDEEGNPIVDENGNQVVNTANLADIPQNQREPIRFAGITNAQLYTNLGEVDFAIKEDEENFENPIEEVEGAKWRFNFLKDQREVTDTYKFPHANEVFYIELDYIPGVTKIENLHFDFKYMNAGGRYEKLEGTYFEQTWTPDSEVAEYCPGDEDHSSHPIKWNYWLDLTSMEEHTSQMLAYGVIGARWYNYAELDLEKPITGPGPENWNYEIYKKVVDPAGNEVSTTDMFVFDVYTNGEFFDRVKVRANTKFRSQTYEVPEGESKPTVEIKEAFEGDVAENYKLIDVQKTTRESDEVDTFEFTATNQEIEHTGYISLTKHADPEHQDWEFQFKLYIDNKLYVGNNTSSDGIITIRPGQTWNSGEIKYTGKAPKYRVEEVNIPEGAKLYKITNKTGTLADKETARIDAYNQKDEPEWESAEISIKKIFDGNVTSNQTFTVKLTVGDKTYIKHLKAGQTWTDKYVWQKGTPAPKYKVEEINLPDGWSLVNIDKPEGTLSSDQKIDIKVINEPTGGPKKGYIAIKKEIETDDKIGVDNNLEFKFSARISGTFECQGESIVNGTKVITATVKPDETWTSPEITWLGDAPSYSVAETELPDGWKQVRISNANGTMQADKTMTVTCVNEYKITTEYDLTMAMSGTVWEDAPLNEEDKNTPDSKPNGLLDDSENRIQNVEIKIWKVLYSGQTEVSRTLATGYEEGSDTEITFPIYTSADGIWSAPRMSVPGISDEEKAQGITRADYDVEFIYDGQTYEPTDFLVSGSAAAFRRGNNSARNEYNKDSMAIDDPEERDAFNNKFATFTGDTPIDDDGVTEGYAVGSNGERTDLTYFSTDSMPSLDGNTRKLSELQTLENGFIKEPFKMPARTSTGGLTWPFDSKFHIDYVDKYLNKIEGGLVIKYHYSATYPYLLNINLGLVKRDEAELSVTKDVYSANVVVNQKLMNYKYNEYVDFETEEYDDYLNLQLKIADANIAYKLDLYESDYYYRAKVYEGNEVYGALQEFYNSIGKTNISDELDLDVFLTYKINVYNNSDSYLAEVKKLTDYFDEDLELVDTTVSRYIQEANGTNVDAETVVATPAKVIKKGPTDGSMWAEQLNKSLEGKITVSDGLVSSSTAIEGPANEEMTPTTNVRAEETKNYYKAEIDLSGSDLTLAVGEKLEVYLTFKVKTDEAPARFDETVTDAVNSYVRLGTKANVAEIGAYSTYYPEDRKVAGRVDKDSAPNNVDVESKNEKSWYEDDADSAPVITLDLYTETRNVNGMAWEDAETEEIDYNQKVGNGIYEDGERKIGNLTTQMVEKVRVKQADGTYREYDFVWPTSKTFDFLNGKTLEEITGFDSITLTGNTAENLGVYGFKNIPAGNYVVRFTYGQFPSDSIDDAGNLIKIESDPMPAEPATSDDNERHPAVYNGQDFKTTEYQADVEHEYAEGGYINDEWYDFATCQYNDAGEVITHNSDAVDNEARRLRVIAYSQVLDNTITTALATANEYSADHTELYNNTYMFADTAKLNLNIENMHNLSGQRIIITNADTGEQQEVIAGGEEAQAGLNSNYVYGKTDVNGNKGTIGLVNYAYHIDAIDVGIEERSNTEVVLDKEIESITVKTNTDDTILKAIYDIEYEYEIDEETGTSSYTANVTLNKDKSFGTENLLAQNKNEEEGLQNFRYIYYDDSIAQGLNLEVGYRFTALNVGEVDRASTFLDGASKEEILAKADEISKQEYRKEGNEFKNIYHPNIGEYVGSIYYIGKDDAYAQSDIVVTTMIRQLIDYVDNDVVFKPEDNRALNSSWKTITAKELSEGKVIDADLIITDDDGNMNIFDDHDIAYTTEQRNNLVLSVDGVEGEQLANPGFIIKLVPFTASTQNGQLDTSCQTSMAMTMTRSIDTQIEEDDLAYDNIAEIVKLENTVGKRDIETIAGNVEPKLGEFEASLFERDASATELITFTPPTGIDTNTTLTIQLLIVAAVALGILAIGIIVIKKTVLKK